jgi:hypothetical protein
MDYVTIQTTGNAADFGNLTQGRGNVKGCSDGQYAVIAGGHALGVAGTDTMDYVTIQTTADAADFGNLLQGGYGTGATSGD